MTDTPPPPHARADEAWARAFSELSHDVRALVAGAWISADAFALASDEAGREKTALHLKSSLSRLVRLAEDLRDVADHLAGRSPDPRVDHDLVAATLSACETLAPVAALRDIELACEDGDVTRHVVQGNPDAWNRSLVRLAEAALSGAPRKSRFAIRLAKGVPDRVEWILPWSLPGLPPDGTLGEAWTTAPVEGGAMFPRSLWLARAFVEAEGGAFAIREGEGGTRELVVTLPGGRS